MYQQTFDTCIFHFPSLLTTEYLVDKWHFSMDIGGVQIL